MAFKFYLLVVSVIALLAGCGNKQDATCRKLSEQFASKEMHPLISWKSFYSKKYDACIHTEEKEVGVYFWIGDLSSSIFKDYKGILTCDSSGADSAILEKVRVHNGYVSNVPYRDWVDDGYGGSPRALKTPAKPYTKEQCRKLFDRWIEELRQ